MNTLKILGYFVKVSIFYLNLLKNFNTYMSTLRFKALETLPLKTLEKIIM